MKQLSYQIITILAIIQACSVILLFILYIVNNYLIYTCKHTSWLFNIAEFLQTKLKLTSILIYTIIGSLSIILFIITYTALTSVY